MSSTSVAALERPQFVSFREAFGYWPKLGFISFGGPAGQISMMHQELVEKRLKVSDLPDAWNGRLEEYLGLTPPNDALGVLQDIPWSGGGIGYFPTYTLGNVLSLQFYRQTLQDVPDLPEQFARGEFGALLGWCSRVGLLAMSGGDESCGACRHCARICRMGAIDEQRKIDAETCILCLDCFEQCPRQIISFSGVLPISRGTGRALCSCPDRRR